ncbi:MAG TPA: type II secretion system F family protein [Candidatus Binataceae bacterium]|nr:type II secretion system F family protein [Candidatus Binataceae bacterium]
MTLIAAAAVFTCVFIMLVIGLTYFTQSAEQNRQVLRRMSQPMGDIEDVDITRKRKPTEHSIFSALADFNMLRSLEEMMWQAGLYMRVSEMVLIIGLLFSAGALLGEMFWKGFFFALATGVGFGMLPILYIRFRRTRRIRAFVAQLPFALDLMKSSLEAGHSLNRGLQVVVQEFADPLGGEFRTVLEQTRIGLPLPRALEDMLKRVPEEDLRLLVVAVKVQSEVGSSLALIVGRLAEIVRTRQRLRLQINALTAQSRLGGIIVGVLPIAVLGMFSLINRDYANELFFDPTGITILKIAAFLDLCAFITIRRLLRMDF